MKILSTIRRSHVRVIPCILGILLALTLTISLPSSVLAIPQLPGRFQGSVTINGKPAPAGIQVSARMSGVNEVFTATTDAQGNYSLFYVRGDDPDTAQKEGGINGDTIQFFVGGANATSCIFSNGASTTLNLNVTVLLGDANGDRALNALDITKVERIIAGLDWPYLGADANLNGKMDALDITKVERLIVGLD